MSAMIGSGEPFLISIIACAASFVGTPTRTIRQFASLRRAISLSVALTSRVSALVMDWTTISAAPPMTTSPTRTGTDLRRVLMTSSQHIVICHQSDQSKQESQPHVVHHLLPSRIDRPSPDQFKYQEGGPTAIQRRERQDVGQAQAEAQERHDADHRQDPRVRRAGGGLDDAHRPFQTAGTEQTTEALISRQLVDATGDAGDRITRLANRQPRRLDGAGLPGPCRRVKPKDVAARIRIQPGCDGQRHQSRVAFDDDRDRRVLSSIQRRGKVFELVDRVRVDGPDDVAGLEPGVVRRCAGIDGTDLDRGFDFSRPDRGVDAEEDQHRQREVEGGSGDDDHEPLPQWMRVEAARTGIHAAVHAGELDEAAQWDGANRVQRLTALPADQLRPETNAELLDFDAGELRGQEVTGLVHDHQQAEDEDDERDEDDRAHAGNLLRTRLAPPADARTWVRAQRSAAIAASSVRSSVGCAASMAARTEGMMSTNRRWPFRKSATASSLAAFSTAGAVPPRSPASRANATAG